MWFQILDKVLLIAAGLLGLFLPQYLFMPSLEPVKDAVLSQKNYSLHSLEGVQMRSFSEKGLLWQLNAKQVLSDPEEDWHLLEIKGFYTLSSGERFNYQGKRGQLKQEESRLYLEEDIELQSPQNYKMVTDKLKFFEDSKKQILFETQDPVRIFDSQKEIEVFSVGLEGNVHQGTALLKSEVSCIQKTAQYKKVKIESDRAAIQGNLYSIEFYKNLRVTQKSFTIRGERAQFIYSPEKKDLESIKVRGNILASDGVKTALSEEAEMRLLDDIIIFQGSPSIRVGSNQMVGEEILITNNQKNIQVRKGNIKSTKRRSLFKNSKKDP